MRHYIKCSTKEKQKKKKGYKKYEKNTNIMIKMCTYMIMLSFYFSVISSCESLLSELLFHFKLSERCHIKLNDWLTEQQTEVPSVTTVKAFQWLVVKISSNN